MKNFDYLQDIEALKDLYKFCSTAEEHQQTDHDLCGWNCRKALEWLIRAIYKLKHAEIPERASLYELSIGRPFAELIGGDEQLLMGVHYVRKMGNIAVHRGGISQKESYYTLLNIYNVVGGVLLRLGVLNTLAPFNKDLIPKKPQLHVATSDEIPEAGDAFVKSVKPENVEQPKTSKVESPLTEAETREWVNETVNMVGCNPVYDAEVNNFINFAHQVVSEKKNNDPALWMAAAALLHYFQRNNAAAMTGAYTNVSKRINTRFTLANLDCGSEKVPMYIHVPDIPDYDVETQELLYPTTNCALYNEHIQVQVKNMLNTPIPANKVVVHALFNGTEVTHTRKSRLWSSRPRSTSAPRRRTSRSTMSSTRP